MTTALLKGAVQFINNTATYTASADVFADASNDLTLTINDPGAYEVNFLSLSPTVVYVWGFVGAVTIPVFS